MKSINNCSFDISSRDYYRETETDLFKFLNNQTYAEADIFTTFSKLMAVGQKEMFDNNSPAKNNPTLMELMVSLMRIYYIYHFRMTFHLSLS